MIGLKEAPYVGTDLGMSLDSKSADKEIKALTSEKSKSCITAFTKKLVTTFQLSRSRSGHVRQRKTCSMLKNSLVGW